MTDRKFALDDSALETVSGGTDLTELRFLDRVDPGSCCAGMEYYVVFGDEWYYGLLAETLSSGAPGDQRLTFFTTICGGVRREERLTVKASQIRTYSGMEPRR